LLQAHPGHLGLPALQDRLVLQDHLGRLSPLNQAMRHHKPLVNQPTSLQKMDTSSRNSLMAPMTKRSTSKTKTEPMFLTKVDERMAQGRNSALRPCMERHP
jgi:hypothetical protein